MRARSRLAEQNEVGSRDIELVEDVLGTVVDLEGMDVLVDELGPEFAGLADLVGLNIAFDPVGLAGLVDLDDEFELRLELAVHDNLGLAEDVELEPAERVGLGGLNIGLDPVGSDVLLAVLAELVGPDELAELDRGDDCKRRELVDEIGLDELESDVAPDDRKLELNEPGSGDPAAKVGIMRWR